MAEERELRKFAKVHRSIYSFNIRKLFIPIKRFVKKSTELTPEKLKEMILSVFSSSKPVKGKLGAKGTVPTQKSNPLFNALIILFLVVVVLGGIFLFVYLSPEQTGPAGPVFEPTVPSVNVTVLNSGFLDSAGTATRWFALLDIKALNATKLNVDFVIQQNFIPSDVYILRIPNYQFASNYDEFYTVLKDTLEEKGIYLSEITVDELLSLPKTRKIVLIVPSGNFPSVLVGKESSSFDMKTFANDGNVLIYIGYKPSDGILYRDSPAPQPIGEGDLSDFLLSFGIEKETSSVFSFQSSLYSVKAVGAPSVRPTVSGSAGAYSVRWEGDGFVYFIPTTVDFWWQFAGSNSSRELANAIVNANWGVGLARIQKTIELNGSIDQQIVVFSSPFSFSDKTRVSKSYGRIYVQAVNEVDGKSELVGISSQVRFPTRPNGILTHDDRAINSIVTGQYLEMTYSLNEASDSLKRLYLSAISMNNTEMFFIPITAGPVSLKLSNAIYRFSNSLPSGQYIIRITDDQRNVFAQSYLDMISFSVQPYIFDFVRGNFVFDVFLQGETERYLGSLPNIQVSFDGGEATSVSFRNGQIAYNATPTSVAGNHTFKFVFGSDTIILPLEYYRPVSMFEKPENIAAILLTVLLFGIGILVARPEKTYYWIDVPDFPPLQAIAVPIKRETVVNMFDNVNKDLRWQNTPLTINDLKMGFKKIMFRGKPLLVGDYNLEMILDKLKEEGYIEQSMEYYGLKRWERETRRSIYYLALVRALRDIFVTEGIPFLAFGQRGDADTVISYGGEKIYIHIFESDKVIKKAIETSSVGRTLIVFENEVIMNEFLSRLHSPSQLNVVFKMLVDNGKIFVTPINKFMDVLEKKVIFTY